MSAPNTPEPLPPEAATSDDLRRRRLVFRCWHRGMREVDLLLGRFADARAGDMSDVDLARLEALLDIADADLYAWLTGSRKPDPRHARVVEAIRVFHADHPIIQDAEGP
jgi:antitoxin CptB